MFIMGHHFAVINVSYPVPMTTQIAYTVGRRPRPTVHFQHPPHDLVTFGASCLVFATSAAINVLYPTPTTRKMTYTVGRRRRPTVHFQHPPRQFHVIRSFMSRFRHNCGNECVVSSTYDTDCLHCGPPAPSDVVFLGLRNVVRPLLQSRYP